MRKREYKFLIGANEWCSLPGLKTPLIKAKVDTGAKTSAIHAYDIKPFMKKNKQWVSFTIHPLQRNDKIFYEVNALVVDERNIISSNGQKERRFVIATELCLGPQHFDIQLTLTNRDILRYRMLLGCEALVGRVIVDPAEKCLLGKYTTKEALKQYKRNK